MKKQIKEEWRPVRGFEDCAEISNYGQIHRFRREWYSGRNHKIKKVQEESWIWGSENNKGYLTTTIGNVKKGVHVWVYLTFVGDIPKGMEVNHLDEDKHNNRLDNLNLLSHGDNMHYGTGIERSAASRRGKKHSEERKEKIGAALSKAIQTLDKDGNVVMEFPSTMEAGRQGFDQSAVSACCLGKRKTHKGFIWCYKENAQV